MYGSHVLVTFGGSFTNAGEAEIWQSGVRCVPASAPAVSRLNYTALWLQNSGAAALRAWFISAAALQRNDARIEWVKCNWILPNGKYEFPANPNTNFVASAAGNKAPNMPNLLMLAWSWRTDRLRGPGSNGRVYTPNVPFAAGGTTDKVLPSDRTSHLAAAKGLLTAINHTPPVVPALVPVVASRVDASLQPIVQVRVGDVVDVQRRRKNAVPEVYASVSFP